ncbi:hypothetical protein [Alteromonas sp. CYL-A6]|uniref:hypothetical protein n=1 Tax=Alteromonas nitratireducens TaxID=3390813 RepID=UPI0034B1D485
MLRISSFRHFASQTAFKLWGLSALFLYSTVVNAQMASTTEDLIKTLQQASTMCSGSCRQVCRQGAEQITGWGTVAGHQQQAAEAMRNCSAAFGSDISIVGKPGTMQQMVSLSMAAGQINTIASKESTQVASNSGNKVQAGFPDLPDLSYLNPEGYIDTDKVIAVLKQLPAFCAPFERMSERNTCIQACGDRAERLQNAVSLYQQDKGKLGQVKGEFTGLMGCESFFGGFSTRDDSFPKLKNFLSQVRQDSLQKWPSPEPLSLELADLEPTSAQKAQDIVEQLRDVNATEKLTFQQAQALLKRHPDYPSLQKRVKNSQYSLSQLQEFFDKLLTQEESYTKANKQNEWKDKARQVGPVGAGAELLAASNESCSLDYLKKYQRQTPWMGYRPFPIDRIYDQGVRNKSELQYQLSAAYLHRLCFAELTESLKQQVAGIQDPDAVEEKIQPYFSQPPITSNSNLFNKGPGRMMSQAEWTPAWIAYVDQLSESARQRERQAHQAQQELLAKQQKEQAEKEKQRQLVEQQADYQQATADYFEAANMQYPVLLDEPEPIYGRLRDSVKRNENTFSFKVLLEDMSKQNTKYLRLVRQISQDNIVTQIGQAAEVPPMDGSSFFVKVRVDDTSLKNLAQCEAAQPQLEKLISNPDALNGKMFLLLVHSVKSCPSAVLAGGAASGTAIMALGSYQRALEREIRAISPAFNPAKFYHQYDNKIAGQFVQQIWGISTEQAVIQYKTKQGKQEQEIKQFKQWATSQPLPSPPYQYSQQERLVIIAHIEQNDWRCPGVTGTRGESLPWKAFTAGLNKCSVISKDSVFRDFAKSYLIEFRNRPDGG